jgi:hypothetical protein
MSRFNVKEIDNLYQIEDTKEKYLIDHWFEYESDADFWCNFINNMDSYYNKRMESYESHERYMSQIFNSGDGTYKP